MNIAVLEDNTHDFDQLSRAIEQFKSKVTIPMTLTRFVDPISLLDGYRSQFDLIFLDIEVPMMNGLDVARKIRAMDESVMIIFLTHFSKYAINGYEVNAADYMLKPLNPYTFSAKMHKVVQQVSHTPNQTITITMKGFIHRFYVNNIYYVEVVNHQLIWHTSEGNIQSRGTLTEAEAALYDYHFRRCNSCYLVNLAHVNWLKKSTVMVANDPLSISRPKKKTFINDLNNYLGGKMV